MAKINERRKPMARIKFGSKTGNLAKIFSSENKDGYWMSGKAKKPKKDVFSVD